MLVIEKALWKLFELIYHWPVVTTVILVMSAIYFGFIKKIGRGEETP
jgi:hypothetical protein